MGKTKTLPIREGISSMLPDDIYNQFIGLLLSSTFLVGVIGALTKLFMDSRMKKHEVEMEIRRKDNIRSIQSKEGHDSKCFSHSHTIGIHKNRAEYLSEVWKQNALLTPLCIVARNANISIIKKAHGPMARIYWMKIFCLWQMMKYMPVRCLKNRIQTILDCIN